MKSVNEFATAHVRTRVYREGPGFRWVREPGPAYDLSPPGVRLDGVHPVLRFPGEPHTYRAGGALPAASWLAFGPAKAGPVLRDALRRTGEALAALHAQPPPEQVTAPHPGLTRLAAWLDDPQGQVAAARLREYARERIGAARLAAVGELCREFTGTGPPVLMHGAASLALIVPGPEPVLLTGEALSRGPWWLDLGWLLAELVELEHAVAAGIAPALAFDYDSLREALLDGYGRTPPPGTHHALGALRVLTHARDFATYVGWDDQLLTYVDIAASMLKKAEKRMYPPAPRLDLVENLHGTPVADPYRPLEDPGDPATKQWLVAQDDLFLEHARDLHHRDRFRDRLARLQSAGFAGPPSWHGDRAFFVRREAGQEHLVLHTLDPDGTERVLLEPEGTTVIDAWQPSPDGGLLAYQLSSGGREESLLSVMDVATGDVVDGPIDRCRSTLVAWLPDGRSFLYVRRLPPDRVPKGEERYHRRVYLHRVGTDPAEDELVFGEGRDKATHYRVNVTNGWLTVSASLGTSPRNDLWLADVSSGRPGAFRVVQEGVDAHTALRVGRDGRAYLMTDRDAPRGRVAVTDPADPLYETWRDLIPEDPEAVLADYALLDDLAEPLLVLSRTRDAVTELTVHDARTGALTGAVPTPGPGTAAALSTRGGPEVWFAYTDVTSPVSVLRHDVRTGETTLWAAPPGSAEPPPVESRVVEYRSKDGTPVRMLVMSAPDAAGPRPCLLTGYGGFGISMAPAFSPQALAWVEAGGVYAVAQLRGGGERGEQWHRAGMRGAKQNVFDDFHAAAEKLTADGLTTPDRLAIMGGSNGGLLVGAALTQRPELYAAAVSSAPLLDMVRYERSGLGAAWSTEYGSAADPEEFAWLYAYSPYHHVRDGVDYPAVLFTVAEGDTRVDPFHARKMCAALQTVSKEGGHAAPVLLRTETDAGHGARAVSSTIALEADVLAFCAAHTGLR